jgi:prepilin-type N-terminal cleavage/methylation domain-containing protein
MVRRWRSQRGMSLLEMMIALLIFGVIIWIVVLFENEMLRFQRTMPLNYLGHPEVVTVVARLRKDIVDAYRYPDTYAGYQQTPQTLILETLLTTGSQTVVWDFTEGGKAKRFSYNVGSRTDWVANGVPNFYVSSFLMPNGEIATRITALDVNKNLAIDQIYEPRPH